MAQTWGDMPRFTRVAESSHAVRDPLDLRSGKYDSCKERAFATISRRTIPAAQPFTREHRG
jgi:hypothetical protein